MQCLSHMGVSESVHASSACICRRMCWLESEWQQAQFLRKVPCSTCPRQNARGCFRGACSAGPGRRDSCVPCLSHKAAEVEHWHQPWLCITVAEASQQLLC